MTSDSDQQCSFQNNSLVMKSDCSGAELYGECFINNPSYYWSVRTDSNEIVAVEITTGITSDSIMIWVTPVNAAQGSSNIIFECFDQNEVLLAKETIVVNVIA